MMTSFFLVNAEFRRMAQFSVSVATEADTFLRPLAVLRMRADRTATLTYFRADKLPDVRAAKLRPVTHGLPCICCRPGLASPCFVPPPRWR
jgi:hypothetical protein